MKLATKMISQYILYPGKHDNDRRLADHFGGKLHLGFIKIREKLDELLVSTLSKFNM
jgi:hypothetical protein